jgi:hypothetical protein
MSFGRAVQCVRTDRLSQVEDGWADYQRSAFVKS